MVQNTLKDGRLKFGDKSKARQDGEPGPKVEEVSIVEPVDVCMVDIAKNTKAYEPGYQEKLKVIFPKDEEGLIDFLNRCKLKYPEVMLYPRCNVDFNKEAVKKLENSNTKHMNKVDRQDQQQGFFKREGPQKAHRPNTYVPHSDAPI